MPVKYVVINHVGAGRMDKRFIPREQSGSPPVISSTTKAEYKASPQDFIIAMDSPLLPFPERDFQVQFAVIPSLVQGRADPCLLSIDCQSRIPHKRIVQDPHILLTLSYIHYLDGAQYVMGLGRRAMQGFVNQVNEFNLGAMVSHCFQFTEDMT